MKKYKCGLYVGRFQPLHIGHTYIIGKMFDECEVVIVAVGSAQESGTQRNPFDFATRGRWIVEAFWAHKNNILHVVPIPDREHPSNDASWGDYLLNKVWSATGMTPDVIYEGEEDERAHWYDNHNISIVSIARSIMPISATEVRQALLDGDEDKFRMRTPISVSIHYEKLREEILKCYS